MQLRCEMICICVFEWVIFHESISLNNQSWLWSKKTLISQRTTRRRKHCGSNWLTPKLQKWRCVIVIMCKSWLKMLRLVIQFLMGLNESFAKHTRTNSEHEAKTKLDVDLQYAWSRWESTFCWKRIKELLKSICVSSSSLYSCWATACVLSSNKFSETLVFSLSQKRTHSR